MTQNPAGPASLRRSIGLAMLVFYGVGVTIGAGIFALIGEVVRIAGDHAPLAFVIAGAIAGATGFSYAQLSSVYPRAAGEAIYVNVGLGRLPSLFVGYGVVVTAIVSSAVISIALGGYLGTLLPIPQWVSIVMVLLLLSGVAWLGVRESVAFAAVITVLELGTLLLIIYFGAPLLVDPDNVARVFKISLDPLVWSSVFSACVIAFFAFIGFEDIVNMAEETIDAPRVVPRAIIYTLVITIIVYALIAMIAVGLPDRLALVRSDAPLAALFEGVTSYPGSGITIMATVAMINGILVQIVMASRVIYGMTREGLAPQYLGALSVARRTPGRAIFLVAIIIVVLALGFPLVNLAQATSLLTLCVFTLVNLALWRIGSRAGSPVALRRWRYWGAFSALLSAGFLLIELTRLL